MFSIDIRGTVYTARTLAGISAAYCKARDESGEGATTWPNVSVIQDGVRIAEMSYNGRVWPLSPYKPGRSPLYCPAADPVADMLAAMKSAESDLMAYCEGLYKKGPRMSVSFAEATTRLAAVRDAIAKAEASRT